MSGFRRALAGELAHLARNRFDLALLTLVPLVFLVVLGGMLSAGTPHGLGVVVVDRDHSAASRGVIRAIGTVESLSLIGTTDDAAEAFSDVRRERAVAVVILPRGLGGARSDAARPTVEIFYQTAFLSTGALASTRLQTTILTELARQAPAARGLAGAALLRAPVPGVEVTVLGNPGTSLEWYLALLIGPAVLHLLIGVTTAASLGRALEGGSLAHWAGSAGTPAAALAGRFLPHVVVGTLWLAAWLLWLTLAQGYRFSGAIGLVLAGGILLFVATAALSALLIALTGEIATSLSASVIYAGSALAYSGASLPLTGGALLARIWSAALPLTHYLTIVMDQAIGVTFAVWLRQAGILCLYPLIAIGAVTLLLRRQQRRAA
jgi:ABC-2 type transport system permease protein